MRAALSDYQANALRTPAGPQDQLSLEDDSHECGYTMSMGLRDKLRMFAGGMLLGFMAAFALAAAAAPGAEPAAQAQASSSFGLSEVFLPHGTVPEHAVSCSEQHNPCGPGGVAPAPAALVVAGAMPGTGLVKAPALLPRPMPDVAPHAAVSLTILFRNFRE